MVSMGKNWNGRQTIKFNLDSHLNNIKKELKTDLPILSSKCDYSVSILDYIKKNFFYLLGLSVIVVTIFCYLYLLFNS